MNNKCLFYKLHDSYWSLLDIQDYDRRYEAAQDFLPPFGVFGYLDDLRDPVESDVEYVLAGYNLAPRLLQRSTRHALIIGNFTRHPCDIEALTEKGLLLVKDFGKDWDEMYPLDKFYQDMHLNLFSKQIVHAENLAGDIATAKSGRYYIGCFLQKAMEAESMWGRFVAFKE